MPRTAPTGGFQAVRQTLLAEPPFINRTSIRSCITRVTSAASGSWRPPWELVRPWQETRGSRGLRQPIQGPRPPRRPHQIPPQKPRHGGGPLPGAARRARPPDQALRLAFRVPVVDKKPPPQPNRTRPHQRAAPLVRARPPTSPFPSCRRRQFPAGQRKRLCPQPARRNLRWTSQPSRPGWSRGLRTHRRRPPSRTRHLSAPLNPRERGCECRCGCRCPLQLRSLPA